MKALNRHHMTILEVLVAMVILVIIMSFLAQMVYRVEHISRRQNQQSEVFRDQKLLMSILEQDLQGMIVSDNSGEEISYLFRKSGAFLGSTVNGSAFITANNLGITSEDSSLLQEVAYAYDPTRLEVIRYFSRESDGGDWNFTDPLNRTNVAWAATFADSVVVATNVDTFYMESFSTTGSFNTTEDTYPAYIVATIQFGTTNADSTTYDFVRKFHFNRGE